MQWIALSLWENNSCRVLPKFETVYSAVRVYVKKIFMCVWLKIVNCVLYFWLGKVWPLRRERHPLFHHFFPRLISYAYNFRKLILSINEFKKRKDWVISGYVIYMWMLLCKMIVEKWKFTRVEKCAWFKIKNAKISLITYDFTVTMQWTLLFCFA